MRTILALLAAGLLMAAEGATLATTLDFDMATDSLGFTPSRRTLTARALLEAGPVDFSVRDRYVDADSGGLVPRGFLGRNDLLTEARVSAGPLQIAPGIRLNTEITDGLPFVYPQAAAVSGTASYDGFTSPFLRLGADLPHSFRFEGRGWMLTRDLTPAEGASPDWSATGASGSLAWTCPRRILTVSAGGAMSSTEADGIGYDSDWSRADLSLRLSPRSLPARTQILGEVRLSSWDGQNYLGNDLGDRVYCGLRTVRWLTPALSFNLAGQAAFDNREDGWTAAAVAGGARLVWTTGRDQLVPTSLAFGGRYTASSFVTSRLEARSRVHVIAGLAALLEADLRLGPSVVTGAPSSSRSAVLGAGLEYRFDRNLLVWARVENARAELSEIQSWGRLSMGAEFVPAILSL